MILYTKHDLNKLRKAFYDFCDKEGYARCNYLEPEINGIEVELIGKVESSGQDKQEKENGQ
jgi:hypothetical protein